jgi:uncharacterized protein (TIGR02246 family)
VPLGDLSLGDLSLGDLSLGDVMRKQLFIISAVALAAACTKEAPGISDTASAMATTQPADDDAAGRAAIEKVHDAWVAAEKKDDAAAVAALYTDDAVFVGTETPAAHGKAAIQEAFAKSFPVSTLTHLESKELVANDKVGYDFGEFTQQVTPPNGKPMTINGQYLVALARQPDGSWKITKHVATTPPAAK